MKKKSQVEYYDSLDILPIYNWDKYIFSRDLNWFIKEFDGSQTRIQDQILSEIEIKLLDQYFIEKNDQEFSKKLQKYAKIDNLNLTYNIVSAIIKRMLSSVSSEFLKMEIETRNSFIDELGFYGLSIPHDNTIDGDIEELMRIDIEKEAIRDQINLLENELKAEGIDTKKDSFGVAFDIIANDWQKNKEINQVNSLDEQLIIKANLLGLDDILNSKEISVLKWIEYIKLIKQIS